MIKRNVTVSYDEFGMFLLLKSCTFSLCSLYMHFLQWVLFTISGRLEDWRVRGCYIFRQFVFVVTPILLYTVAVKTIAYWLISILNSFGFSIFLNNLAGEKTADNYYEYNDLLPANAQKNLDYLGP